MKFLIQQINGIFMNDFTLTIYHAINFYKWRDKDSNISFESINGRVIDDYQFTDKHKSYVPVGTIDFVHKYFKDLYGHTPKPINVPSELFWFANREISNINHMDIEDIETGDYIIKSNTNIKGFIDKIKIRVFGEIPQLPPDNYQISSIIDIVSEWRCFVYDRKIVGLQNYSGDFTKFPNLNIIKGIVAKYESSPIAYTLDIGIDGFDLNSVIEVHNFYSCGLYGFSDYDKLPRMQYEWFVEYKLKNGLK